MAESQQSVTNFKEAFCAQFRISSERYARTVLWRALPLTRRPLAVPLLLFFPRYFATDLDLIQCLGRSRSSEYFAQQLDELHAVNRSRRNLLRTLFGIRPSGVRLMSLWHQVESQILPGRIPSGQ